MLFCGVLDLYMFVGGLFMLALDLLFKEIGVPASRWSIMWPIALTEPRDFLFEAVDGLSGFLEVTNLLILSLPFIYS